MKRIFQKTVAMLCAFVLVTAVSVRQKASANEITLNLSYQQNENCFRISGTAGSKAQTALLLKIYREDQSDVTSESINNNSALAKVIYTGANGEYSYVFSLGKLFKSGGYIVRIDNSALGTANGRFLHVNPDEASKIIEAINKSTSVDEVSELLTQNCYQIGIDSAEYEQKNEYIDNMIFKRKPQSGYTSNSFSAEYNNVLCSFDIKYSSEEIKSIFEKYQETIGLDYANDVYVYGEKVESMLAERMKKQDYTVISVKDSVKQNLIVSRVICADRYTYLEEIMEEEFSINDYNLEKYNKIKDLDLVYKKIFNKRTNIEEYSDLKQIFEDACDEVINEQNEVKTEGNSSSGGGGGGGSLKSVSIAAPTDNEGQENDSLFTDINNQHWAFEYISYMKKNKLADGYSDGTYRPSDFITRAEFVKFVVNVYKLNSNNFTNSFNDVKSDDWYFKCINVAAANSIITGANGLFRPNDKISRQDAAVILYRAQKNMLSAVDEAVAFGDEAEIADYAVEAVKKLSSSNIINGDNGNFYPIRNITRAEVAAMLVRTINR